MPKTDYADAMSIWGKLAGAAAGLAMFPAAALLAWSVLGYIAVEFELIHKVVDMGERGEPFYRAASEASHSMR